MVYPLPPEFPEYELNVYGICYSRDIYDLEAQVNLAMTFGFYPVEGLVVVNKGEATWFYQAVMVFPD